MSTKRKHKTLDLKDKMDILKQIDSGENMCKLAKEYGVGRTTIHDIKKKKQMIEDHVKTMESGPGKRKTLRVGGCPKMEKDLYTWFIQQRSQNTPVTGEILRAKAIEFYEKYTEKDDFRASDGWLDKFKRRFGIRLSNISGETLSRDESAVQPSNEKLETFDDKLEELDPLPDQIDNVEESLFWSTEETPNQIFVSLKETSPPGLKNEESVESNESIHDNSEMTHFETPSRPYKRKADDATIDKTMEVLNYADDSYDTFGKHVAAELRKYDSITLAHVKKGIMDVIFRADVGTLPVRPLYEYELSPVSNPVSSTAKRKPTALRVPVEQPEVEIKAEQSDLVW